MISGRGTVIKVNILLFGDGLPLSTAGLPIKKSSNVVSRQDLRNSKQLKIGVIQNVVSLHQRGTVINLTDNVGPKSISFHRQPQSVFSRVLD